MRTVEIEKELRAMRSWYKVAVDNGELGAAISHREEMGRYVLKNIDDILRMLHAYNAPMSEPEEASDDAVPF